MMLFIKKTSLLLLLVVCFSTTLKFTAQVPGYVGKRLSAGYGFYIQPAFSSVFSNYGNYPVNTQHEFYVEYVTGKKFSLGFSGQFYRYRYNNNAHVDPPVSLNTSVYTVNGINNNPTPEGSYVIKGRNFKLYGKFYKYGYLAPWGKYFLLGIVLNRYVTVYNPDEMRLEGTTDVTSYATPLPSTVRQLYYFNDFGPTQQTFQRVDLFFGNGNSRIIANKIILDYGYSIGCIAMTQLFIDALDLDTRPTTNNYIEKTSRTRVAAVNRFNFYFKIGYLF